MTHTHMHTKIKINKNESAHMLVFQQILKTKLVYKKKTKQIAELEADSRNYKQGLFKRKMPLLPYGHGSQHRSWKPSKARESTSLMV